MNGKSPRVDWRESWEKKRGNNKIDTSIYLDRGILDLDRGAIS